MPETTRFPLVGPERGKYSYAFQQRAATLRAVAEAQGGMTEKEIRQLAAEFRAAAEAQE